VVQPAKIAAAAKALTPLGGAESSNFHGELCSSRGGPVVWDPQQNTSLKGLAMLDWYDSSLVVKGDRPSMHLDPTIATPARRSRVGRVDQDGIAHQAQSSLAALWRKAAAIDSTLMLNHRYGARLRRKFIDAEPYSRTRLFDSLALRRPVIFRDFIVKLSQGEARYNGEVIDFLRRALPKRQRVRARIGPRQEFRSIPIGDVLERWERRRSLVTVTDLHFRGTRLEKRIDVNALSDFNLLLLGSEDLALQEMMTLVVSSAGTFTDSHSDDPDGSNHCFVGEKLWLAWETFEGKTAGFEDVSRDDVGDKAAFDMRTFLSLRSSCWFVVSDGQTLFLPGSLTHKVVTLRPYLGVGSFFVSFAGGLETLMRWYEHGPLWAGRSSDNDDLVDEIARIMRQRLRTLSNASDARRAQWGCSYLYSAVEKLLCEGPERRQKWERHSQFVKLISDAHACCRSPVGAKSFARRFEFSKLGSKPRDHTSGKGTGNP
jgi:hypothetical protein